MKNFCTSVFLLLLFICISNYTIAQKSESDPDLPRIANGIDKEDYLLSRESFLNKKRGINEKLDYNPRLKAIGEMKSFQLNGKKSPVGLASSNWVELGPSPIPNGQTDSIQVAVSGRVTCIAVNNTNPNILYVGTANGGIFRSMNGGASWTAIFDGGASLAIGALALAPSNNSILYVGTGESNLSQDSYAGVGVYRIDNCDATPSLVGPINPNYTFTSTLNQVTTTHCFTFRSVSKITVDPTNPANIFVATSTGVAGNPGISPSTFVPPAGLVGLYRSTNATAALNSISFTKLTVTTFGSLDNPGTGNRRISDMVMDPGNPNTIVCWVYGDTTLNDGGMFRSINALSANPTFTQTYREITKGGSRTNLSIARQGGDVVIYAATSQSASGTTCGSGSGALYKSRDGGLTWSSKLNGGGGFCGGQCFYDIAIGVAANDTNKLLLGGASSSGCSKIMQRSIDAGGIFTSNPKGLHADSHAVIFAPSDASIAYTGNDGGIFKSTDGGGTWSSMNTSGFKATQYQSLALHPINPNFTLGGTQDNGTNLLQSDKSFNRVDFGDGGNTAIDQNAKDQFNVVMYHTYFNQKNNLIGFAGINSGELATEGFWGFAGCYRDNNVVKSHNGIHCTDDVLFYAPLTLGGGNPNIIYFGTDRLYRSSNGGDTSIVVSQEPIEPGTPITSIAVSKKNDNIRLVGLTNGDVWYTTTGDANLLSLDPAISVFKEVGRVAYDSLLNIAYVTYGGYGLQNGEHVWKCTNLLSATPVWTKSGFGIPDVPVNAFAIDPVNSKILYAGTDIGVYQSIDSGASWAPFNNNLPVVPIFDMAIHPVTRVLRIATHGRGLWETTTLSPLPVSFISLTAVPQKFGKVAVEWVTSSEINNNGFELQRALGNNSSLEWKDISFIKGAGNSTTNTKYNYDDYPSGGNKFFYRIKQIDFDGHFKYSDVKEVELRDFDYALFQNTPNPASSLTMIKYQLPVAGKVSMTLYNSLGVAVKNLVNEAKQPGIYEVRFSTSGLPNGNYYYKFSANDFSLTKQLNIIK